MKIENDIPANVQMDASKLDGIEALTRKAIEDKITASLNMAVVRHGKLVYHEAFGNMALAGDSRPVPLDALYAVKSISKPITSVVIMMLQERKLLDVNDPVQKYLPEFTGKGKSKVRIRHLLTHTSGMCDEDIYKHCDALRKTFMVPDRKPAYIQRDAGWWLRALNAPLTKPTGKEMSYCNTGYNMLGFIVKVATGRSLNAFARENLFKPLGMKDTSYVKSPRQIEGRVVERMPREGDRINHMCSPRTFNRMSGCCSVSTTAYDLAVFGQMLLNGGEYDGARVLSRKSVELLTTNRIPGVPAVYGAETFTEAAWGYGFNTHGVQNNYPTNRAYSHGGYAGSYLFIDPVLDMVVVTLKALHFIEEIDYAGAVEAAVDACLDYESLKTQPL